MAYSNYEGFVEVNGKELPNNIDATPKNVLSEKESYKPFLRYYLEVPEENRKQLDLMYHAVVGDKDSGVLVCLYKTYVDQIYIIKDDGSVEPVDQNILDKLGEILDEIARDMSSRLYTIEINGCVIKFNRSHFPSYVVCRMVDKLGRKWNAHSRYCDVKPESIIVKEEED